MNRELRTVNQTPLTEIIRNEIMRNGPVRFDWFMECALYHPEFGYYAGARQRIGRTGDFYTNVSVGPVFGDVLASQLLEMWDKLGRTNEFTIVEQGAEDGQLAFDILSAFRYRIGLLPAEIRYKIVEPDPSKERRQRAILEPDFAGKTAWVARVADLESLTGVFLSNELVDAFPVRIVEYRDDRWSELLVENRGTGFNFISAEALDPELATALLKLPVPATQPYRTEINLNSARWIESVAAKLKSGFVLTIDYGFSREEFYKPERTEGTLTAYSKHRRIHSVLEDPGNIDITAHVDFTFLAETGRNAGLTIGGYTDQHHFMVGAAEADLRRFEKEIEEKGPTKRHSAFLAGYRTLMHPGTMGMAFKYLLLQKEVSGKTAISGFRYGGDPMKTLGFYVDKVAPLKKS